MSIQNIPSDQRTPTQGKEIPGKEGKGFTHEKHDISDKAKLQRLKNSVQATGRGDLTAKEHLILENNGDEKNNSTLESAITEYVEKPLLEYGQFREADSDKNRGTKNTLLSSINNKRENVHSHIGDKILEGVLSKQGDITKNMGSEIDNRQPKALVDDKEQTLFSPLRPAVSRAGGEISSDRLNSLVTDHIERVYHLKGENKGSVFQLSNQVLPQTHLSIQFNSGHLNIVFSTSNPYSRQMIENHQEKLQKELKKKYPAVSVSLGNTHAIAISNDGEALNNV